MQSLCEILKAHVRLNGASPMPHAAVSTLAYKMKKKHNATHTKNE